MSATMFAELKRHETTGKSLTEVTLRIPSTFRLQLVFRQERTEAIPAQWIDGVSFTFCDTLREYLRLFREVRRVAGIRGAIKGCVRILTKRRMFYCVREEGRIVHSAWATASYCRHYFVERHAAVIGPIWSAPEVRGRGIATYASQHGINELVSRGYSVIYIDTSSTNHSCLRVIQNCGFGDPMTAYVHE